PERIRSDEDLRKILRIAKTTSKTKLTVSLETPTTNFSAWTFKDVCEEYGLVPGTTDPGLEELPPFAGIQTALLESDLEKMLNKLLNEVGLRVDALKLLGANESTRSMVVASFLLAVTKLYLYLESQRDLVDAEEMVQ
ncbi:hypothetical protein CPB97_004029, partial [Podila verticillata]